VSCQLCERIIFLIALFVTFFCGQVGNCQWEGREEQLNAVEKVFGNPMDAVRLSPKERVWIDRKTHQVIVDGYIAINEGQLEMFACPVFTKEHESVVAVFARSITIHAGLLAVGAETGSTAKWEPEYTAPTGSEIQIQAFWKDETGESRDIDARKWVRDLSGKDKHLEPNWVFAGSGFWEDPDTKQKVYNAESGDLICVSNFSTAALDIPMKSTQANSGLIFVAYTANIPMPGTPVRLILQVVNPKPTTTVPPGEPDAKQEQVANNPDVGAETKTEAKPEAITDIKPEAITEAKPQAKSAVEQNVDNPNAMWSWIAGVAVLCLLGVLCVGWIVTKSKSKP
jgi:hypothetical protein